VNTVIFREQIWTAAAPTRAGDHYAVDGGGDPDVLLLRDHVPVDVA
jgi:hypothetical protein